MGIFFHAASVRSDNLDEVLSFFVRGGAAHGLTVVHRTRPERVEEFIAPVPPKDGWTSMQFNMMSEWQEVVRDFSRSLETSAFWFTIYDGDYWSYHFHDCGVEVAKFMSMPGYWGDDEPWAPWRWTGNIEKVLEIIERSDKLAAVSPYLIHVTDETPVVKVHPDDSCDVTDCWAVAEFIVRLGLPNPASDRECGTIYLNGKE